MSRLLAMVFLLGLSGCAASYRNVPLPEVDLCQSFPLVGLGQPEDGLFHRALYDAQAAADSMGYSISCSLTPSDTPLTAEVSIRLGESHCDMRFNEDAVRTGFRSHGRYTTVALFGHEIGHVISTMETNTFPPYQESQLFSDRVAGRVLRVLGVDRQEFNEVVEWFDARGAERTAAFIGGYEECDHE